MQAFFPLSPRYRLDDDSLWLVGIDPVRRYWVAVNGDKTCTVQIPGLLIGAIADFRAILLQFRALAPGETLTIPTLAQPTEIYCVAKNCYALIDPSNDALVWHLFDHESIESLLMTAHPDWQCSSKDIALGQRLMTQAWQQAVAA